MEIQCSSMCWAVHSADHGACRSFISDAWMKWWLQMMIILDESMRRYLFAFRLWFGFFPRSVFRIVCDVNFCFNAFHNKCNFSTRSFLFIIFFLFTSFWSYCLLHLCVLPYTIQSRPKASARVSGTIFSRRMYSNQKKKTELCMKKALWRKE